MTDTTTGIADATDVQTASNQTAEPETFTTDSISREYFGPGSHAEGAQYYAKVLSVTEPAGVKVLSNFDMSSEQVPENYGLYFLPLYKRSEGKEGLELEQVIVAAVPSLDAIANYKTENVDGQAWIQDAVTDAFATKLASAAKAREKAGDASIRLPFEISDFLERRKKGETLKTFTTLAPKVISAFKQMGFKHLSAPQLRICLASRQAAESLFPKIDQSVWVKTLQGMRGMAEKAKLDTAILDDWLNNRDQREAEEPKEIDADKLAEVLGNVA